MMHSRILPSLAICAFVLLTAEGAGAQVAVTAPNTTVNVTSSDEWAVRTFQDPMDMSQFTDLSWFAYSADQPSSGLSGATYAACSYPAAGSCFKATTNSSGFANVYVLETGNLGTAHLGRTGDSYSIDSSTYKMFAVRMRLTGAGVNSPTSSSATWSFTSMGRFIWSPGTIYNSDQTSAGNFFTYSGWNTYLINLPALTIPGGPTAHAWTSSAQRTLRFDFTALPSVTAEIDWIRLVPTPATQNITWTGAASADIYLDDDQTRANGNLGLIVQNNLFPTDGRPSASISSPYAFPPSALPPGDYFVEVCPAGTAPTLASCGYSAGKYHVSSQPTITFDSPSPEGSTDDFATLQLNDAWDMASLNDVDGSFNTSGLTAASISAVDEAGNSLGTVNVVQGASVTTAPGDPYLYLNFPGGGAVKKIDSNRYHILTFEMGIPNKPRDINGGSIARIVWQVQGDTLPNVSADIIVNHRAGVNVMNKIIADMKTLPLESDPGASPSTTGWTSNIENFRVDPHEFTPVTSFYVKQVKLAANEQPAPDKTYVIRWTYGDPLSVANPTLTLFYDADTNSANGMTAIAGPINPATTSSFTWNTNGVTSGTYYIYSSISNGTNTNATYSKWPIVITGTTAPVDRPRMILNRSLLNFGGTGHGASLTPAQQVNLNLVGTGAGSVGWTVTPIDPRVLVSPSGGTGSGVFNVSIQSSTTYPDNFQGDWSVKIEETAPGTTSNSAQFIRVFLQMYGTTGPLPTPPFGSFDTPVAGAAVQGSIAVTGWALDDRGVSRVEIWRDLVSGETTPPYPGPGPGTGKVFIANTVFIEGARPDVEAAYSAAPLQYRSGWGYLLLTWGLWNQGNGPYQLYAFAYDNDGNAVTLGTKTITVSNATATKPFGALDVPEYGLTKSGQFFNFGWALTPGPNAVDGRSCTIFNPNVFVGIDSGPLIPVIYGDNRPDIAAAFSGFSNGAAGGGHFLIDTTTMANATHQIGWFVVDDCGRADGIGSRFFNVFNGSSLVAATSAAVRPVAMAAALSADAAVQAGDTVTARRNQGEWQAVDVTTDGVRIVELKEMERLELQLPEGAASYAGGQVVNGLVRGLPLGSSLDAQAGVFYWQPAAGFIGAYDLVFASRAAQAVVQNSSPPPQALRVRVVVGPPLRMAIDAPAAGAIDSQPFLVAGWAIDLAARDGSGVDTVHVWAHPIAGGSPVFLGVAAVGEARPDVAATYGDRFAGSSYNLVAKPPAPGVYDIVVYVHRAATNSFDGAQVVRVTVR